MLHCDIVFCGILLLYTSYKSFTNINAYNSYYRFFFRGLNAKKTSKIIHRENEMEVKTCYRLLNFEYKKFFFFALVE